MRNRKMAIDFIKERAKNEQNVTLSSYYEEAARAMETLALIEEAIEDAKKNASKYYVDTIAFANIEKILSK